MLRWSHDDRPWRQIPFKLPCGQREDSGAVRHSQQRARTHLLSCYCCRPAITSGSPLSVQIKPPNYPPPLLEVSLFFRFSDILQIGAGEPPWLNAWEATMTSWGRWWCSTASHRAERTRHPSRLESTEERKKGGCGQWPVTPGHPARDQCDPDERSTPRPGDVNAKWPGWQGKTSNNNRHTAANRPKCAHQTTFRSHSSGSSARATRTQGR